MNENLNNTRIKNNMNYREFLKTNAIMIIKNNFQNIIVDPRKNTYPYVFYGIEDTTQPYGYENSLPKQMYLSEQQIDKTKKYVLL
jgi:hypothetical protein